MLSLLSLPLLCAAPALGASNLGTSPLLAPALPPVLLAAWQGPPVHQRRPTTGPGGSGENGRTYRGPGDTASPSGTGVTSAPGSVTGAGPQTEGSSRPVAARPSGASTGTSVLPTPVSLTTTDDDGWWLWWEYNKVEFLRPNRLDFSFVPVSGDDPAEALRIAARQVRAEVMPAFVAGAASTSADVRAAAAIALGRAGGSASVSVLVGLLADPNLAVRERTILALGATGSPEAAGHLLSIARTGSLSATPGVRIAPSARALAIVALGFLRAHGFEASIDVDIAGLVRGRTGADREPIAVAACVYQTLAPNAELQKVALELAGDERESPSVRCRAAEALRTANDEASFKRLQQLLSGPRLDLRRSAALALATMPREAALASLQTAFQTEAEPLTRGFLLTSIGRRGTPAAREFLEIQLERGGSGARSWAALGLGLWAHKTHDASAAAAIRAASDREKNREMHGAYWIALGLARDASSIPAIAMSLAGASDPRERMYAATGLALIGGDDAHAALAGRLAEERQSLVRVLIAQGLGTFGRPEDAPALAELLDGFEDVSLQAQVSSAAAMHGTPEALAALRAQAEAAKGSSIRLAAALEGLGILLSRSTPLRLCDVSRQANYTVFSEWVDDMFQTTL
jgi:HEAT repeat protein